MTALIKILIVIALLGAVYFLLRLQSRKYRKRAGERRFSKPGR